MVIRLVSASILVFISIILPSSAKSYFGDKVAKIACFKATCVNLEIADTEYRRKQGLMFRKYLSADSGMLFIFNEEARYGFWMKNMNFPLDIIWIGRDKKVIDISKNIPPCGGECKSVLPKLKAKYALEVASGFADRNNIDIGEEVTFQYTPAPIAY